MMTAEEASSSKSDEDGIPGLTESEREGSFSYRGRLYGVHRLDRVTSGILVLAKNAATARRLACAFRTSSASSAGGNNSNSGKRDLVVKYYVGISRHPATKKKQGWVKGYMERGRRKSWRLIPQKSKQSDEASEDLKRSSSNRFFAKTRFFTRGLGHLNRNNEIGTGVGDDDVSEPTTTTIPRTLLLFRPYTGRTHQLRVAAKSVGLPLMGDPIYSDGSSSSSTSRSPIKVVDAAATSAYDDEEPTSSPSIHSRHRTYLHATALRIVLDDEDEEDEGINTDVDGAAVRDEQNKKMDVMVFSPPPFEHLWEEDVGRQTFRNLFLDLFRRHCEDDDLVNHVLSSPFSQNASLYSPSL